MKKAINCVEMYPVYTLEDPEDCDVPIEVDDALVAEYNDTMNRFDDLQRRLARLKP